MALPTQAQYDAATQEFGEPVRAMLRAQHSALLDLEHDIATALENGASNTSNLALLDARVVLLETLVTDGVTDTPTVAEMTTNPPIFTGGIFQGLTP